MWDAHVAVGDMNGGFVSEGFPAGEAAMVDRRGGDEKNNSQTPTNRQLVPRRGPREHRTPSCVSYAYSRELWEDMPTVDEERFCPTRESPCAAPDIDDVVGASTPEKVDTPLTLRPPFSSPLNPP